MTDIPDEAVEAARLESLFASLQTNGCAVEPCGSRVTCNPPPDDTDQDYLVEIIDADRDRVARIVNALSGAGFTWEGTAHYQDAAATNFMSWRNDEAINLIVTAHPDFARRHRVATAVCARLNLMDKQDRIALFQAVLYGNLWDGSARAPKNPADDIKNTEEEIAF